MRLKTNKLKGAMDITEIKKRIKSLETYKEENKVARQALSDELENNPSYIESCDVVKEAMLKRKQIKDEIIAQPETQKIILNIKENKEEVETLEEILSTELVEYFHEKKVSEIEDADGEKRQFKIVVKILPKKKHWEDRDIDGKYASKVEPDLPPTPAALASEPEVKKDETEKTKEEKKEN